MNRHVVVRCGEGCSHKMTRFEQKQLEPLSEAARDARLHIRHEVSGEEQQAPKSTKPPIVRRRPVQQFAH